MKNILKTKPSLAVLIAAVGATTLPFIISPTMAQAQTQAQNDDKSVEIVVVTARKKSEAAKDVPISIGALRGDALTNATAAGGATDMTLLSARLPSLVIESSNGRAAPRAYIRGLGNTDFDLNASQPVSFVYDEVVYENPALKGFPIFDVASVELLRGPQGTLFGRNTPAGILKFDSVKPGDDSNGYLKAGYRTYDGVDAEGAYGAKITDTLSFRVSALYSHLGDWVNNTGPAPDKKIGGYDDTAVRAQLLWQPSDNFDTLLSVHHRDVDATAQLFRTGIMTKGQRGVNPDFKWDTVNFDGGNGNPQSIKTTGGFIKSNLHFGDLTLTSISDIENLEYSSRGDVDGSSLTVPFSSDSADKVDYLQQITQEFRLANDKAAKFNWQTGLYYFHEDAKISTYGYYANTDDAWFGYGKQHQKTESWAVFGSGTYKLSDALSVTAGVRYTDDKKTFGATRSTDGLTPTPVSLSDSAVSWDLSAVYKASPDTNFYTRVARGYRAPAIQGRILFADPALGPVITTAKSEYSTSIEGGIKTYGFNRRVSFDLSVYAYMIDDMQLTAIGGDSNVARLLNANKGYGKGFEAELKWRPTNNLSLNASVSLNDTKIEDSKLGVAPCSFNVCTVLSPVVNGKALVDGNPFPNAPKWIGDVGAKYTLPLENGNDLYFQTDWAYKGETNFFLYKSIEYTEGGFWEGGARVGYIIGDKYEIAAYGRNITNEKRLVGGLDFVQLTGFTNNPRVWGVEGKVKF